jgi:hypothetical protein
MASSASAQVIPTDQWVHFFSQNSTLNGQPLPIGAIVDTYDPDGVHCGRFIVHTIGKYGYLSVYHDDSYTPGVDEGALSDDTITIMVNGVLADVLGPDDPEWTFNFAFLQIDLGVLINLALELTTPPDDLGAPDDFVDYTYKVKNTGEGIDFFNLEAISSGGWTVEIPGGDATGYLNPGEETDVVVRVYVPGTAQDGDTDDLTLTASSAMDATVSENGTVMTSVIESAAGDPYDPLIPGVFHLRQNFPNPFNPVTTIEFSIEKAMDVELVVYNVIGQEVKTLANRHLEIGTHQFEWDATDEGGQRVASGIYFYRLITDEYARTCKMMLMK